MHPKDANPAHPIHDLLSTRWSPYAFSGRPVETTVLCSLFEAARWAASSFNEQPWRYLVATKEDTDGYAKMLSCLVEANQTWAKSAPVLAIGVASLRFSRNDKPNKVAYHDLGLASANLTVEAGAHGLSVHQMAGIEPDEVRRVYSVPEGYEPLTALAIGYAAPAEEAPEEFRERDLSPRPRNPLDAFVFADSWGEAAVWAGRDSA